MAVCASIMLSAGCASVNREFRHANIDALKLNETTIDDMKTLFGKPGGRKKIYNISGHFKLFQYRHQSSGPSDLSTRSLNLEFKDSLLNAYIYNSNFKEDATDFNYDAKDRLIIAKSTADDAVRILGEPNAKGLCPTFLIDHRQTCRKGDTVSGWVYTSKPAGLDDGATANQLVMIIFDTNRVVKYIHTEIQKY